MWINDSPGNAHWLELKLEGSEQSRWHRRAHQGYGRRHVQYNHVSFAAGYASSSAAPTHFGLGTAASASLVEIRWPSGVVQALKDVPADRVIRVKEPHQ